MQIVVSTTLARQAPDGSTRELRVSFASDANDMFTSAQEFIDMVMREAFPVPPEKKKLPTAMEIRQRYGGPQVNASEGREESKIQSGGAA